jgi:hypothetical protein
LECPSLERHHKGAETDTCVPYDSPTDEPKTTEKREEAAKVREPTGAEEVRGSAEAKESK